MKSESRLSTQPVYERVRRIWSCNSAVATRAH